MRASPHSQAREKIVADAISPIASELRLIDAADLVALLRFECYGNLADLVSSAAELYFLPGTVKLGNGGEYALDWNTLPEIRLDIEIKPIGATVFARLVLSDVTAGVEVLHIAFDRPSPDPDVNTAFLANALQEAAFQTKPEREAN